MTTILNYFMIKKVLIVLPFYLFTFLPLSAQTYTQRIQQQNGNGQGTVTIHQDADIDKLVNSEVLNKTPSRQPQLINLPHRILLRQGRRPRPTNLQHPTV